MMADIDKIQSSTSFFPAFLANNGLAQLVSQGISKLSRQRSALNLSNPGTVDNIKREVEKDVLLTKHMFTGLRADFARPLSMSPLFQYSHAFAMGSQMPPYGFSALFGNQGVFLQGNVDNDGQFGAVFNYRWTPNFVMKSQASLAPGQPGMLQLDADYTGQDFTASIKSINPSILDGGVSGIVVGSYLQSVTPRLAIGMETVWQRMGISQGPETVQSYCARYRGNDWIASAQLTGSGALSTTYWRRLTDKVEAGVDLNMQIALGQQSGMGEPGAPKEATTAVGAKYDFRVSTFRAQLDSTGKVGCLLEKRIMPAVTVTFAGEMDQSKSQAKVGMAVSIEVAPEEIQELAVSEGATQTSVPF